MHGCGKCKKASAVLLLLVGLAFLGKDLGWWSFWNITWYTALFLVIGISWTAKSCCGDCCKEDEKAKKR
ncbi:MAG TPA: hypothetical protein VJJ21_04280 [Candidatus Nanoarchaeia archaeon]|nr:hypothetical protein [Candidatus Nanoarchaeia archaeon]